MAEDNLGSGYVQFKVEVIEIGNEQGVEEVENELSELEDFAHAQQNSSSQSYSAIPGFDQLIEEGIVDEDTLRNQRQLFLPNEDGGSTIWYQCKYCHVLLADVMMFIFHLRLHQDNPTPSSTQLALGGVERHITESGVQIFSPNIPLTRVTENEMPVELPPMPRLSRAPVRYDQELIDSAVSTRRTQRNSALPDDTIPRKCKLCNPQLDFPNRTQFVDHLFQAHRHGHEFRCSKQLCRFRTRSVQFLEDHMENHPEPYSRYYTCHICQPKTHWFQSTKYARHMESHRHNDGRFHCAHCNYSTLTLQLLNKHNKSRHPQYITSPNSQTQSSSASRPMQAGRDTRRRYVCYYCTRSWFARNVYETHMITSHKDVDGSYHCSECSFFGKTIRLISRHLKYKHCGGSDRPRPKRTIKLEVDSESPPVLVPEVEGYIEGYHDLSYESDESKKSFSMGERLTPHRETETKVKEQPTAEDLGPLNSDKPTCSLCRPLVVSPNSTEYFDHVFQTHTRDNFILCPKCNFKSDSLATVSVHMKKHFGRSRAKPKSKQSKLLSLRTKHNGGARFHCRYCYAQFYEVSKYSTHMKTHLNANGYFICTYCRLPYPTLNRFNEHVKRRHEMLGHALPSNVMPSQQTKLPASTILRQKALGRVQLSRSRKHVGIAGGSSRKHAKKNFVCLYCSQDGVPFYSVKVYARHMRELHQNWDGFYSCPHCPSFPPTSLKRINEHMKRKGHQFSNSIPDETEENDILNPLLRNASTTEVMDMGEEGEQQIQNYTTPGASSRWFQCKVCFILMESKAKLILHQKTVHSIGPHAEEHALYPLFESLSDYRQLSTEKPRPTRVEDETDYLGLLNEENEVDQSTLTPAYTRLTHKLQMPLHKCKTCSPPSWFRTLAKLNEHWMETHHMIPPVLTPNASPKKARPRATPKTNGITYSVPSGSQRPPGRTITCVFCLESFTKQSIYIEHMKQMHMDEDGNYNCPTCLIYSSPEITKATKHIRRHALAVNYAPPPARDVMSKPQSSMNASTENIATTTNATATTKTTNALTTTTRKRKRAGRFNIRSKRRRTNNSPKLPQLEQMVPDDEFAF